MPLPDTHKTRPDLFDAAHPIRQLAIAILTNVDDRLGNPKAMQSPTWYTLEDETTTLIAGHMQESGQLTEEEADEATAR